MQSKPASNLPVALSRVGLRREESGRVLRLIGGRVTTKIRRWLLILLAAVAVKASAADVTGIWEARFTGPIGERPKMVSKMVFNIRVEGENVTGMAHMSVWPGDAPITEGKIEGNKISFTVVGEKPWTAGGSSRYSSGYPKLVFTGTVNGEKMQLTVRWGSVMIYGTLAGGEQVLEMEGVRVSSLN